MAARPETDTVRTTFLYVTGPRSSIELKPPRSDDEQTNVTARKPSSIGPQPLENGCILSHRIFLVFSHIYWCLSLNGLSKPISTCRHHLYCKNRWQYLMPLTAAAQQSKTITRALQPIPHAHPPQNVLSRHCSSPQRVGRPTRTGLQEWFGLVHCQGGITSR